MNGHTYIIIGFLVLITSFACQKKQAGISALSMNVPVLETGRQQPMPFEWIDKDTNYKIIKLSRLEGGERSFYFHNNPFMK